MRLSNNLWHLVFVIVFGVFMSDFGQEKGAKSSVGEESVQEPGGQQKNVIGEDKQGKSEEKADDDVAKDESVMPEKKESELPAVAEDSSITSSEKNKSVSTDESTTPTIAPAKTPAEAPVKAQAEPEPPEEIAGIDTVDIDEPQGNWLLKRIWYERAQDSYEKIAALVESIMEARMSFFDERTKLDKEVFDPFYLYVGIGRGEFEQILSDLVAQMKGEREDQIVLDEQEREFVEKLKEEQAAVEQLALDVQSINRVDEAVEDAIKVLLEQINKARSFEKDSWQKFKAIGQELSDKKARELFYSMKVMAGNVKDIYTYLTSAFSDHFNQLSKTAREQAEKIKATVEELKTKGINFKKQMETFEQKSHQEELDKLAEEKDEAIQDAIKQTLESRSSLGRFFDSVSAHAMNIGGSIMTGPKKLWHGISRLGVMIGSGLMSVGRTLKEWMILIGQIMYSGIQKIYRAIHGLVNRFKVAKVERPLQSQEVIAHEGVQEEGSAALPKAAAISEESADNDEPEQKIDRPTAADSDAESKGKEVGQARVEATKESPVIPAQEKQVIEEQKVADL